MTTEAGIVNPPCSVSRIDPANVMPLADIEAALEANESTTHADPAAAITVASRCAASARHHSAPALMARAQYQWARAAVATGAVADALSLIEQAHDAYVEAGMAVAALRTRLGHMHALDELGRHAESAGVAEAALHRLDSLDVTERHTEPAQWLQAALLENLGVAYGLSGQHESALQAYRQAEGVYTSLDLDDDRAHARANQGVELVEIGEIERGLTLLEESAATFEAAGDLVWLGTALTHIAEAKVAGGDALAAFASLHRSRRSLAEVGARPEAARAAAALAEVSLALSLSDEAAAFAAEAAHEFRALGLPHDVARSLRWSGLAAANLGRQGEAIGHLIEAGALFADVGANASAAEAVLAAAGLLRQQGAEPPASAHIEQARRWLSTAEPSIRRTLSLLLLADLSPPPERDRYLAQASQGIDQLRVPTLLRHLHLRLGRACRERGDDHAAQHHLRFAVDLTDDLQSLIPDQALRAVFLDGKRDTIDEYCDFLLSRPVPESVVAFELLDRARVRTLREMSGRPEQDPAADRADPVVQDLAAVYGALMSNRGTVAEQNRLLARARELERTATMDRLANLPVSSAADRAATKGSTAASGPTSPVVLYEVLRGRVHAFVQAAGNTHHVPLQVGIEGIAGLIDELDRQWVQCRLGPRFIDRHRDRLTATCRATLGELYRHLIAPLDAVLDLATAGDHIGVVPSHILHRVPFHALHDGEAFLNDTHTVSVSLGASMATPHLQSVRPHRDRTLVIGVTDPSIPYARREAEAVGALLGSDRVLVDADATVRRFREEAPGSSVVHMACHGLHRAESPLFSALRLGDGWINAHDIMSLDLRGATVVLSACESGWQASNGGEGLGLGWAFLSAGASAVVVSLWPVQDDATAEMMAAFYEALTDTDAPSALRAARHRVAERWPHPYHWAPFAHLGPLAGVSTDQQEFHR